jgi:hypothetical protein
MEIINKLIGDGLSDLSSKIKPINKNQAINDYEKLKSIECNNINPASNIGNVSMDYFTFKYRLQTKVKRIFDFPTFWKNKDYLKTPSGIRLFNYGLENGKNKYIAAYDVFRLYKGSSNAFKPIIAKQLYCMYKPKTILDFSAGWGGRLIGAMSLDINYIGIDTNINLKKAYEGIIETYQSKSNIEMIFKDSSKIDYNKYDYDFVFTSPPYWKKTYLTEKYENMPIYTDKTDFYNSFIFPVIIKTFNGMKKNGYYCLNIPIDMYDEIKIILGESDKKYPLFIQSRFSGKITNYKEFIYVWKKKKNLPLSNLKKPQ